MAKKKFDPMGDGFDDETFEKLGLKADPSGHKSSFTGQNPNMLLKGIAHPTFTKTKVIERELGNKIVKRNGRFFSEQMTDKEKQIERNRTEFRRQNQ